VNREVELHYSSVRASMEPTWAYMLAWHFRIVPGKMIAQVTPNVLACTATHNLSAETNES
jgi:hypothetical protein